MSPIETIATVAAAASLAFVGGASYAVHHAEPVVQVRHVAAPLPWDPSFKVCQSTHDHKCLFVHGKAWWVK